MSYDCCTRSTLPVNKILGYYHEGNSGKCDDKRYDNMEYMIITGVTPAIYTAVACVLGEEA